MAADPVVVTCPAETWTEVATNVLAGVVHILDFSPDKYLQTYRLAASGPPADLSDAVPFETPLQISADAGIDVYIYPRGQAGSVRVDL